MRRLVLALALLLLAAGGSLIVIEGMEARVTPVPAVTSVPSPTPSAIAAVTPRPTPRPIPDGYRVRVDRLAIDLPIKEGDIQVHANEGSTPDDYAFHLPGTGIPGEGRNSYFYAHARPKMFITLWQAVVGDVVLIVRPDGSSLTYVVSEVHPRVAPTDLSWAQATAPERVTLQTSTGPNPDDPRFVVVARPQSQ